MNSPEQIICSIEEIRGSLVTGEKGDCASRIFFLKKPNGDEVVLRLPPEWVNIKKQQELLHKIACSGIPVPRIEAFGELDGQRWCLMTRLPGVQGTDLLSELMPDEKRKIGRDMAILQRRLAQQISASFGKVNGHDLFSWRRWFDEGWGGAKTPSCPPVFPVHVAKRVQSITSGSLCHYDLHPSNILLMRLEDDVCISGIVDFDEALFGDRLYDVAATRTILKWYAEDDMMLGYENGTALSPDEEEVVAFYVEYIVAVERFPPSIVKRFGP